MKKLLIFLFIISLLFVSISNTVNADQSYHYIINSFEKGLNSHTNPYVVPKNQCITAKNLRFNNTHGSFAKRDPMRLYGTMGSFAVTSLYRYYNSSGDEQLLATGSTVLMIGSDSAGTFSNLKISLSDGKRWQWVTYDDKAIGCYDSGQPIKYDGKTTTTSDTDGARTEDNLVAELGAPFAELNTGTDLDSEKWYQYKVGFYNSTTGLYSYSTAKSNPILTGANVYNITLTDIPLGVSGVTSRFIYRTEGGIDQATVEADTSYFKVAEINDNTTTTYDDAIADATISADPAPTWALASAGSNVTPPKGAFPCIHDEKLFIGGNSTYPSEIYWSDTYNPDVFPSSNYEKMRIDDGDEITFVKEQAGVLTIGKTNSILRYYTKATIWYYQRMSTIGCPAPYSVANTPKGIVYYNRAGLYLFNGQYSTLISDAVTTEIEDVLQSNLDNISGFYWNNEYHFAYISETAGGSINDRVLILDFTRNAYTLDYKNTSCFAVFNSGDDEGIIYSGSSDSDGYVWSNETGFSFLKFKLESEFDAGTWDDARVYGTERRPIVEIAWDCTINGWSAENIARGGTDGTIDNLIGIIDRPDTAGTWTSAVSLVNASTYNTLLWNESLGSTGNITFNIRSGATSAACSSATWSDAFSSPAGSDISGETAAAYIQLKANLSTTDIVYTPTLYYADNFVVKLLYNKSGTTTESAFASEWESGWSDCDVVGKKKQIMNIKVYYQGTSGTLTVSIINDEGDYSDSYEIDLSVAEDDSETDDYKGSGIYKYFTYYCPIGGSDPVTAIGEFFRINISDSSADSWTIDKIDFECQGIRNEYD